MRFVILGHVSRAKGKTGTSHVVEVAKPWPDALPSRRFAGPGAGGELRARIHVSFGSGGAGKRQALFSVMNGALVLQRDVAKKLPADLREGLTPISFVPGKKKPALKDYVLVPVDRYAPLDREASGLGCNKGVDPLVGHVVTLAKLAFAHPDALPGLFRLVEAPHVLVAREDVAALLTKITSGEIVEQKDLSTVRFPPDSVQVDPQKIDVKTSRAAHRAFWELLASGGKGGASKKLRATALQNPLLAVAVGLAVDRAPAADTRTAAMKSPYWSAIYALHVDRGAREDTRAAARADADGAVAYADEVDLEADDSVRKKMLTKKGWWDRESADSFLASLAERRQENRGGGATGNKQVATRDLPKRKAVTRYREKARGSIAPLSSELRSDVEAMTALGLEWLGVAADVPPSEVIDALHAAVDALRAGDRKLPGGSKAGQTKLGLACALADAFHRGLGWQWATVAPGGVAAVVSPDDAHGIVPLTPITRVLAKGKPSNTIALLFNMVAAGNMAPAVKGKVAFMS